ncbi:uncharacterized protein LDX57_007162 [Aspergillus melleus]|uniref:uncharacterized protein n=1 Tax=Aspergillus melleus TaxID=138277 RepID=UPI001E8D3DFC|nr:uncharacterized protein LDX57_007162 [Aspergillus melleus]KAH8429500.1 hypothetical protein LDX57_007162 [Aspergillus melleus]
MTVYHNSISLPGRPDVLERVTELLTKSKHQDHYVYDKHGCWYMGFGNQSSLVVSPNGLKATTSRGSRKEEHIIHGPITDVARDFLSKHGRPGHKTFVAHVESDGPPDLCRVINDNASVVASSPAQLISTDDTAGEYTTRVKQVQKEISQGQYAKFIPSQKIQLQEKIDMPAALLHGRPANDPARGFSLRCGGLQATGFSPELVMSVHQGKVITEPLAGTRSGKSTEEDINALRQDLRTEMVVVEDLMSVRLRGSVQHLGSHVAGQLSEKTDAWDAFDVLFPSITASEIPKQPALEAIEPLEPDRRELYSGAVLMLDGDEFEAALILRTLFQDDRRQWVQAGAGIIAQSKPERESTETREKMMESSVPFLVQENSP